MNARQSNLLKLIIESHIKTGEPIGSSFLVESAGLAMSGATVRNEMRDLEEAGYLSHPHTSAGRVPTEAGYQFYVERLVRPAEPAHEVVRELRGMKTQESEYRMLSKAIGKYISEQVDNAVIIVFGGENVYYTGISLLFSQPEFRDYAHTVEMSAIFDHCEERMDDLYGALNASETKVLIGAKNPLGDACSLVGSRVNGDDIFAILGPMRMNYSQNVGLMNHIHALI